MSCCCKRKFVEGYLRLCMRNSPASRAVDGRRCVREHDLRTLWRLLHLHGSGHFKVGNISRRRKVHGSGALDGARIRSKRDLTDLQQPGLHDDAMHRRLQLDSRI